MLKKRSGMRWGWLQAVVLPTTVAVVLLAFLVGLVLQLATGRSDALAVQGQNKLVLGAVRDAYTSLAVDQEASTLWDDAVMRVHQRPLDMVWLDNNLGIWFHTYYKIDEVYLLDPQDRPIYAMRDGKRVPVSEFSRVASESLQLAGILRARLREGAEVSADNPGMTLGVRDIELLDGRPVLYSVKPIQSETGRIPQVSGSEYLHISLRFLDGSFLNEMEERYRLESAHFTAKPDSGGAVALKSSEGKRLGYISWTAFQPGGQVKERLLPVLALALALIGAVIAGLLWRNWRGRIELEASRAHAEHLAFHDPLTGLPNRALFEERLNLALRQARRNFPAAVLLLDLDRFKHVNDTFGHQVGDALIRDFGARFSVLLREHDLVARFGGDEFAIIIENARPHDVEKLCRRLMLAVARPFAVPGGQAHVGVSIGVAMAPEQGGDATELTRQADIALYRAKEDGRNTYRVFNIEMDDTVKLRSTIEKELRSALETGEGLSLHFQPMVSAPNGSIAGLEALARWNHPTRGMIEPEIFIPVAEESGLIEPLGEWVLREACRVSTLFPGPFMSINLSPLQFRAPNFTDSVIGIVSQSGADPGSIQLEITERLLLQSDTGANAALERLRGAGFCIALDDFGTGYSSLSYLHKFAVDKIKIDQTFVRALGTLDDSSGIVTAVLALGKAMNLAVAAEGVETAAQCQFLADAGCNEMQGNLFSPGVPEDKLAELFASYPKWPGWR